MSRFVGREVFATDFRALRAGLGLPPDWVTLEASALSFKAGNGAVSMSCSVGMVNDSSSSKESQLHRLLRPRNRLSQIGFMSPSSRFEHLLTVGLGRVYRRRGPLAQCRVMAFRLLRIKHTLGFMTGRIQDAA